MKKETNWFNLLKLNLSVPVWNRMGSFEATTIHVAKTNECIIDDWQTFSNIEEENELAAIAVLGYMHEWKECHLFVGIRNLNEDFFTSGVTSLFTNSSCGIFPMVRNTRWKSRGKSISTTLWPCNPLSIIFLMGKATSW